MDDLIALPAPVSRDSRQPSPAEQAFAGRYLHLAGLALFLAGLLSFMRQSGGLLQAGLGFAVGGALLLAGDRCHRQGLKEYAQGLLGGGLGILLMTVCASHFYYRLIGLPALAAGLIAVVVLSGIAVCRYDSQTLGNLTLTGLLAAPFLMKFQFGGFTAIFAYLVAVNLGVTLVAFVKRWDFQLLGCLIGSYALYFHFFAQERPRYSMLFLAVVYGLFLVSNNLLHFLRPGASDCNLGLSYVNPTVFAVVSYYVLEQLANLAPVAVYLVLAAVHLLLAVAARRNRLRDASFADLAVSNQVMGLLFLTASVSFVNHFYDMHDTKSYIALATGLWFGLAFVLQSCRGRIERRYGMLCLGLTLFNQVTAIPWMIEGRTELVIFSIAAYLIYGGRSRSQEPEDVQAGVVSFAAAGLLVLALGALPYLLGLAALAAALRWLRTLSLAVILRAVYAVVLLSTQLYTSSWGQGATLAWALLALAGLRFLTPLSVVALTAAFLKSTLVDLGFSSVWGTLTAVKLLAGAGLTLTFLAAARLAPQKDQRTLFTLLGLVEFTFQMTDVLFNLYGILDEFQIILSAFWCLAGFLFTAAGLQLTAPVPRLFGLTILVASALKICLVDLWVLNAYTQTTTLTILGALLMATGFLYQRHRLPEELQFA